MEIKVKNRLDETLVVEKIVVKTSVKAGISLFTASPERADLYPFEVYIVPAARWRLGSVRLDILVSSRAENNSAQANCCQKRRKATKRTKKTNNRD